MLLRALGGPLLALLALASPASAAVPAIDVPAGAGTVLRVEPAPFRLALLDRARRELVATVPGAPGPGVRQPGADGPEPVEPLGPAGAFPALGFVTGVRGGATHPLGLFAGNRLLGAEAGAVVSLTRVESAERRRGGGAVLRVAVDAPGAGPAELRLEPVRTGGVRVELRAPAGLPAVSTLLSLSTPRAEALYGLGARKDAFDQRGRLRNVWVEQQNAADERTEPVVGPDYTFPNGAQAAYYVQPALFGSRGWAAWMGGTALQRLDLAHSHPERIRWGVAAPSLAITLAGGGLDRSSRAFTAATGRAPAPPRWVYEPWIDVINRGEGEAAPNGAGFAGGARVKADLESIARRARELRVPIGVLGVEGWQTVPDGRAFFRRLRRQGFRLSAYWNPFTHPNAGAPYAEALQRGLFIRDPAGRPFPILTSRNNVDYAIDFTHPGAAAYWERQIARSAELGFEGFMHDFGEFVTDGMVFHDGTPPELAHNAYPTAYHAAARRAIDRRPKREQPWFYVRSGYTGTTASTSGVFPGDETTDWARGSGLPSVVPAMLNLALGGAYTFTTDVGGYFDFVAPRTTKELLIRWSQLAAFTPVSRIHNSTAKGPLLPWDVDAETVSVYRRYARAKLRLVPLVDRWSRRAARTGVIGPVRPLVLEDQALRRVRDQWLLGNDLLVAPVLERGASERRVELPAGARWRPVRPDARGRLVATGPSVRGGRAVTVPVSLADIPLFERAERPRRRLRARM